MGKPQKPEEPDYEGAARAQGEANLAAGAQSVRMSNPIMDTPYGSQNVEYLEDGRPAITQRLTPVGQQTLEQQQLAELGLATTGNEQATNIRNLLNTPFSFGGTPQGQLDTSQIAKMPVNAGTTAQQAIMSRLEPHLKQARTSTETQLINQGLRPGGEAYDNAARLLGEQENDARQQAALQGINIDMGANQQGFNQALQSGQFGNTAIQQQLAQALNLRDQPINEITALLSGSQVQNPQFPGYQGTQITPSPLFQGTQAQGQWDMEQYKQQVAQRNAMMGGLFGLAAAPFSMFNFGGK